MSKIKETFIHKITESFPELTVEQLRPLVADNLLSPFKIEISNSVLKQAKMVIKEFFSLRQSSSYQGRFSSNPLINPKNHSILMSYDFHLTDDNQLKLIEINTNAAFLALGSFMNQAHQLRGFDFEILKKDILNELLLFGKPNSNPKVSIIDENPREQRLYCEFLVYQQLFKSWGWDCQIKDLTQVDGTEDFIYNRFTDFYLSEEKSKKLRELFQNKKVCFSPHPYEYLLLADKQRLIDISQNSLLNLPQIPFCQILNADTAEDIWAKRKNYFLKPLSSFGAKQSYRGATISRKMFDSLINGGFIAQEYIPPGERIFLTPDGEQKFKFDLRFYAYQDQFEFAVARLYQGQVTNLRTPWGGFAPVVYSS